AGRRRAREGRRRPRPVRRSSAVASAARRFRRTFGTHLNTPGSLPEMNARPALWTACLAVLLPAAVAVAWAQDIAQTAPAAPTTAPATPTVEAAPVRTLAPFDARYAVYRDGKPLGDATLQLVSLANARWRVDLHIEATHGLLGFAGLDLQQSTVFDVAGAHYRPLSQSTVRKAIFSRRMTTGVYDWSHHAARWTGDVKKTRRGEVPLREGDMSGLLI